MMELLAPAGSMDALRAAVQNGANAVYLGCGEFNARQSAKNFTPQTLAEAVKYCHIRGVQVHLTLNTLVTDREMDKLCELIRFAAKCGVDAFIVQDLGIIQLCRQIAPGVAIHGSTQMTVHSLPGVQLCAAMGLSRVVLSRELSRDEIAYICAKSPIEIEIFTHGALCMCYSGQCYLSAAIGSRSGNRGRCAQPCRQSYGYNHWEGKYPLSLKDNCLVQYLADCEAMGVASVKLEGRMKRPEYVATVTNVYRAAMDSRSVTKEMMDALMLAFNRQGFTDGYYTGNVNLDMFGIREEPSTDPERIRREEAFLADARRSYEAGERPLVPVWFEAVVSPEGSFLTGTDDHGNTVRTRGANPQPGINRSLTNEELANRIARTGGTPFRAEEVRCSVTPGLMLSAADINAMRRDVLNQLIALRARREDAPVRKAKPVPFFKGHSGLPALTIQITSEEQLTEKLLNFESAVLYIPIHILSKDAELCRKLCRMRTVCAVLPRIAHDSEIEQLRAQMVYLREYGLRQVLVGNLGLLIPAREAGMEIRGDFGLNLFNSASMNVARDLEFSSVTASFELTLPQIRDMSKAVDTEILAYGRMMLMVTEHCLMKNKTGKCICGTGLTKITDKTGAEFPIIKDCGTCRSVLLNGKKLNWLDRQKDLSRLGLWAMRIVFTTENPNEVNRVLDDCLSGAPFDPGACTRGLYLRGVE